MLIFQGGTLEQLCDYAVQDYPNECCGILLGKRLGKRRITLKVISTKNTAKKSDITTHFLINPLEVAKAEAAAEDIGLEIIGFYHSHPDFEAQVSQTDVLHMIEGFSYPIISVKKGKCGSISSFEKIEQTDADANREEILVKENDYADFGIHISNIEELLQSKAEN